MFANRSKLERLGLARRAAVEGTPRGEQRVRGNITAVVAVSQRVSS